jgi:UDP-N-acetylglucosamine--N-acetylmuramyl-(pentapeptide) pyrophosphoryl-undecaprenol N-acetylglucosamine transferase
VVSLGGDAALAAAVAAVTCARRLVLVDLDATPSAVHRLLHRRARRICTAFASADARSVTTGAPLRGSITAISRDGVRTNVAASAARDALCWTVVVMTGSLGAKSVNRATIELAQLWRARGDVRLVHVTGRRDYEWCVAQWQSESSDRLRYEQVAFADMATLWSEADLAVTRAGATTVAELTYLAIPAVLVPLPGAPGDHQTHNANALVHAGGAVMVADRAVSGESLAVLLDELLNLDRLRIMSDASRTLRHEDAAAAIAREVLAVAT